MTDSEYLAAHQFIVERHNEELEEIRKLRALDLQFDTSINETKLLSNAALTLISRGEFTRWDLVRGLSFLVMKLLESYRASR